MPPRSSMAAIEVRAGKLCYLSRVINKITVASVTPTDDEQVLVSSDLLIAEIANRGRFELDSNQPSEEYDEQVTDGCHRH